MLIRSSFSLRSKNHLNTRLQLKDERANAYRLIPWLALADISFGFVDWFIRPDGNVYLFFGIRIFSVILSRALYLYSRGRCRYGLRLFFTVAPYMYGVEYIMLSQGLVLSPYFSGLGLVMVTSTMLFPVRLKLAVTVYTMCVAPVFFWIGLHPLSNITDTLNVILMLIGTVAVCSINSGQVYQDLREKFQAAEALARDLGKREKEIRRKAEELLKRKVFESQFSPQVVSAVLKDRSLTREMKRLEVVNIVIDIQNSTSKANCLDPKHYKEVVEEVLDVFSASCLKWNITLDKFTGDGVQAFAGAPVSDKDDLRRAIMACKDTMHMLRARKSHLEVLWKDELNVRFAVCKGEALVGFIGRGIFKSYTAIGDMISFTHRLSSVPDPWTVAAYNWNPSEPTESNHLGFSCQFRGVSGLKGFGERKFNVAFLIPEEQVSQILDAGRCAVCGTPLVIEDGPGGLPRVFCSGCQSTEEAKAA